jgi:protein CpxP
MIKIIKPASRAFAAAALFGAVALALPALAQTTPAPADASKPAASKSATKTVTPAHHRGGVEEHLANLHKQLKITPAQEAQWSDYANVEREKAKNFEALATERKANIDTMSAVDDLRSYAKFTEANADSVKKMVPAFEALYNSMSDAQKKNADQYFAQAEKRREARHASNAKK